MQDFGKLIKTKTFWVGVAALLTAVTAAVFGDSEHPSRTVSAIIGLLIADPRVYVGLAAITGRHALVRGGLE